MPTYTYQCKTCETSLDVFHAMTAKPRVKCAACGGSCRRLIGAGAGILFKGSGFYETDYKRGNGKGGAKTESEGESKTETKAETKTESKTESKGESKTESKSESKTVSSSSTTSKD